MLSCQLIRPRPLISASGRVSDDGCGLTATSGIKSTRSEPELAQSETQLETRPAVDALSLLQALSEPAVLLEPHGTVAAANGPFGALLGHSGSECTGLNLLALSDAPREILADYLRRCAGSFEPLPGSLTLSVPGRESSEIAVVGVAVAGLVLLRARASDIALEHQLAEVRETNRMLEQQVEQRARQLSASRARLRAFFDNSPDWLTLQRVTPDGRFVYEDLNPTCEAGYGLSPSEVIGRTVEEVLGEQAKVPLHYLRECLRTGRPQRYVARRHMAGETRTIDVMFVLVPSLPSEADRYIITTARDLTERERLEDELRQAQKMEALGQLTGGIAHDFNNLLTVIIGNIERLQLLLPRGETGPQQRAAANALHGAERGAELTQRLLAFSRRQPLDPKPTDINRLVLHISDLLRSTLSADIVIETVMEPDLWPVSVDPNQLENAAVNLAVNARDAMPNGGTLTIETVNLSLAGAAPGDVADGAYVMIAFSDTGTGMSDEVQAHLFEPFFTTKPSGKGTGLGLSQVYGFVRQSGGSIRVHSEAGIGTTVRLYLPALARAAEEPARDRARPEYPREDRCACVLVVEDEEHVRSFTTELLRELGYGVLEAPDGQSALRLIERRPEIDLLFTDMCLPGMGGAQLARAARRIRPGLKVLYTSGYPGPPSAGADDGPATEGEVIAKPFTYAGLAAKLQALLGPLQRRTLAAAQNQ